MERGRDYRRRQYRRMVAKAERIIRNIWGVSELMPERFADNLRKCSCYICSRSRRYQGPGAQELRRPLELEDF